MTKLLRLRPLVVSLTFATTLLFATASMSAPLQAQRYVPSPSSGETFKDTSILKPPAGAKMAIIVFEDLECPACARAFPIKHQASAHYNIPIVRRDFPLQMHVWSRDAAVWARYLQAKVSPKTADDYRGAVFAAQTSIASKDDMLSFTRRFFQSHGIQMPFVADPTGSLLKDVMADYAVGEKLGIMYTPSITVCTQHEWVHVTDINSLYQVIDELKAKVGSSAPVTAAKSVRKPANY